MDLAERLHVVEGENDQLRERVRQLEEAIGFRVTLPVGLGLTGKERALVGALYKRKGLMTKDALMAALYRDFGKDEPEMKIVDVFVCKARAKLKPFGIEIETIWGQGYAMGEASKAKLRAMMGTGE